MQQELTLADLAAQMVRIQESMDSLAERVDKLERGRAARPRVAGGAAATGGLALPAGVPGWAESYEVAKLELGDVWIEMHEHSARRQLHRLICEVVETEGPVTEQLCLRRVREAWGIKRAGARIQQVFDQAVRQLDVAGHIRRAGDSVLVLGEEQQIRVRVPSDDATRRSIDEIPPQEIELALHSLLRDVAVDVAIDDLTMHVARMFGWTRRGAEIQNTLNARVQSLVDRGAVERSGDMVRAATVDEPVGEDAADGQAPSVLA